MTATILNYLVYLYTFLELYVFVYTQELRIKSHYEYFEHLAQLNCIEIEEVTPLLSPAIAHVIEVEPPVQVTVSELDDAAEGLFAELQRELGISESLETELMLTDESELNFLQEYWVDDTISLSDYQPEEDDEDCIHLSDLKDEEENQTTGFEAFASAKIADCMEGPQQWVVSIVGMEESYIHISDGKRLWVHVGEKASKLRNGDVLILDVFRNGNEVIVDNLFRLESGPSTDYAILDEDFNIQDERIAI